MATDSKLGWSFANRLGIAFEASHEDIQIKENYGVYNIFALAQPSMLIYVYAIIAFIVFILIAIIWGISEDHTAGGLTMTGFIVLLVSSFMIRKLNVKDNVGDVVEKNVDTGARESNIAEALRNEKDSWWHAPFTSSKFMSGEGYSGYGALKAQPFVYHIAFIIVVVLILLMIVYCSRNENVKNSSMFGTIIGILSGCVVMWIGALIINKFYGGLEARIQLPKYNIIASQQIGANSVVLAKAAA